MFVIFNKLSIPDDEIELSAIRAQGAAGGQNINKDMCKRSILIVLVMNFLLVGTVQAHSK